MSYVIAVAGKGGSGKTTAASLIVYHLIRARQVPVLAVDADPNANLNLSLGLKVEETIADLREEALKETPQGMSRTEFVNLKLQEAITEGENLDLLVMGRSEGPGCYCAVNNLLRGHLSKVAQNYKYVVIDNEAGMEHLSRRTTNDVDLLLLVSEPTVVGLRSCLNICRTISKIPLKIKNTFLVINKVHNGLPGQVQEELKNIKVPFLGQIPYDKGVIESCERGENLQHLSNNSQASLALKEIMVQAGVL